MQSDRAAEPQVSGRTSTSSLGGPGKPRRQARSAARSAGVSRSQTLDASATRPFSAGSASVDGSVGGYNKREKTQEAIHRLTEHRLREEHKQTQLRQQLEGYARQQRRRLVESVRVGNECARQVRCRRL